MPRSQFSPISVRGKLRHKQALELRAQGLTFQQIGDQMGFSKVRARAIVKEEIEKVEIDSADLATALREEQLVSLKYLWNHAKAVLEDPEGDKLAAVGTCLKVMDRTAKLMGLDAPSKRVSISGSLADLSASELEERCKRYGIIVDASPVPAVPMPPPGQPEDLHLPMQTPQPLRLVYANVEEKDAHQHADE